MKTFTIKGYWRGELQVEECSVEEFYQVFKDAK